MFKCTVRNILSFHVKFEKGIKNEGCKHNTISTTTEYIIVHYTNLCVTYMKKECIL